MLDGFCFRNVIVETCVQEKVAKEQDVLAAIWINTAQVFVTAERRLMKNW